MTTLLVGKPGAGAYLRRQKRSVCACYLLLCWLWLLETLWMNDVHNALSSTALPSSCGFMPMASMDLIHLIFGLTFFLLTSVFPSIIAFQRTLPSYDVSGVGQIQFCICASRDVSGFICSRTCLFIFLMAQGICRAFLQHQISNESFFFPFSLIHYRTCTSVHSNW